MKKNPSIAREKNLIRNLLISKRISSPKKKKFQKGKEIPIFHSPMETFWDKVNARLTEIEQGIDEELGIVEDKEMVAEKAPKKISHPDMDDLAELYLQMNMEDDPDFAMDESEESEEDEEEESEDDEESEDEKELDLKEENEYEKFIRARKLCGHPEEALIRVWVEEHPQLPKFFRMVMTTPGFPLSLCLYFRAMLCPLEISETECLFLMDVDGTKYYVSTEKPHYRKVSSEGEEETFKSFPKLWEASATPD